MVNRSEMWWAMVLEEVAASSMMECTIPREVAVSCRTGGIFEPVGLELPREALVKPGVCLGVSRFSGVGQTMQEVGRCNRPPCLRKQLFPKSAHLALEVLGVPNSVTVDLGELDARDGCILESRIDQ